MILGEPMDTPPFITEGKRICHESKILQSKATLLCERTEGLVAEVRSLTDEAVKNLAESRRLLAALKLQTQSDAGGGSGQASSWLRDAGPVGQNRALAEGALPSLITDKESGRKRLTFAIKEIDRTRGILTLAIVGELDIATMTPHRHFLSMPLNLFGQGNVKWIVLDLSECKHVDSSGLGLFVRLMKTAREAGGNSIFVSPPPCIQRMFEKTRLFQILTITETMEQATKMIETRRE